MPRLNKKKENAVIRSIGGPPRIRPDIEFNPSIHNNIIVVLNANVIKPIFFKFFAFLALSFVII